MRRATDRIAPLASPLLEVACTTKGCEELSSIVLVIRSYRGTDCFYACFQHEEQLLTAALGVARERAAERAGS